MRNTDKTTNINHIRIMEAKELTIIDECQMEGAIIVLQRYAHHLKKHLRNAVTNYESTDFDQVAFLADVAYALDNADVVMQTAEMIKETLKAMRAEVSPIFNDNQEGE